MISIFIFSKIFPKDFNIRNTNHIYINIIYNFISIDIFI